MTTCPLLDNVFSSAAKLAAEHASDNTLVTCNLATNQSTVGDTDENVVSYGYGNLLYSSGIVSPPAVKGPPAFSGSLTQLFSNRTYPIGPTGVGPDLGEAPFDPARPDTLDISITGRSPLEESYSVKLHSPKWGGTFSFTPQCEAGVIYGAWGSNVLVVISLCQFTFTATPK